MLRLDCPVCGLRDHDEFTYLEDGSITYPKLTNENQDDWFDAVYLCSYAWTICFYDGWL